ncbi:heparan-alpha-glucosaminide N-acetyltransferase [Pseudorhodobacter turbinis]|uniref:heparan-alpha-glucosaminide N-acetyltransferase n=1 Tax=Pseudorhodobacter turbinis TaxID=2500533 RepID=UPI00143CE1A4|nr:heparan-alpha-glucosaminide N-acetyltransferase [Pseudorhodobacter turbinis]
MRQQQERILWLDMARALAVVGMVVYHFTFDLAMFGYIPAPTPVTGFWAIFARAVAGSFIALAGFGLVLAHWRGIGWRRFWRRLGIVAAGAALVSLATWFVMPGQFVFFGILHSIALSSVIGLAFLRLHWVGMLGLAAAVIALPQVWRDVIFDAPPLWFVGLSAHVRPSIDFEPFFPWFGAFLIGMAVAKLMLSAGPMARSTPTPAMERVSFIGRHSLVIYLIHQPVLIGLFISWNWLNG